MSVTVSIPTILRPHTGGEKRVDASGETLQAVISDLEANYSGISERLVENGKLHRFVNIYVNDDDIRYLQKEQTPLKGGVWIDRTLFETLHDGAAIAAHRIDIAIIFLRPRSSSEPQMFS